MGTPQAITNEISTDKTGGASANENARQVVDVDVAHRLIDQFFYEGAAKLKEQITAAGIEALTSLDKKVEIAAASVPEAFRIGKKTSKGLVFIEQRNLENGSVCNIFELPVSLRDRIGGIFTCDDTIRKTANLQVDGRVCFTADPAAYRNKLLDYLGRHISEHAGDDNAESQLFISPWAQPVQKMVQHKLAHGVGSDFVLPERRGSILEDIVQTCEPYRDGPDYRYVVFGPGGGVAGCHRDNGRFGGALFLAAPVPR